MDPYQPSSLSTKTKSTLAPRIGVEGSGLSGLVDMLIFGFRRRRARADRQHICNCSAITMVSVLPIFLKSGEMERREDGWEIWAKLAGSDITIRILLSETTITVHVSIVSGTPVDILRQAQEVTPEAYTF